MEKSIFKAKTFDDLFLDYEVNEILGVGASGVVLKLVPKVKKNLIPIALKISDNLFECDMNLNFKHIFEDPETMDLFAKFYYCFTYSGMNQFDKTMIIENIDSKETKEKANEILNQESFYNYEKGFKDYRDVKNKSLVFILSEYVDGKPFYYTFRDDKEVRKEDICNLAFEIRYAIDLVWKKYNFNHNDLHLNNILIIKNEIPRRYIIKGKSYIVNSKYQPKIIDFDRAKLGADKQSLDYNTVVNEIISLQDKLFYYPLNITIKDLTDNLLNQFKEKKDEKVGFKCHVCYKRAEKCFESNPAYKFCGEKCAIKMAFLF